VYIGPLTLVSESPPAWWSPQMGGWISGLSGATLGVLGLLVGILAATGSGRGPAMAICTLLTVLGILALIAGAMAAAGSQPYAVFYPLLLMGVLGAGVFGPLLLVLSVRYRNTRLRRGQAGAV
jgi:hypothetical protein